MRNIWQWTKRNGEIDRFRLSLVVVLPIVAFWSGLGALVPAPGSDRAAPAFIAVTAAMAWCTIALAANRRL